MITLNDFIVLGIIFRRPQSGYDLKKEIRRGHKKLWPDISQKHIYYSLEKLEKNGLLEKKKVQEGRRPEKTIYSINNKGKKIFKKTIIENKFMEQDVFFNFDIILAFLDILTNAERDSVIDKKIGYIENELKRYKEESKFYKGKVSEIIWVIYKHKEGFLKSELKWAVGLKKRVEEEGWSNLFVWPKIGES